MQEWLLIGASGHAMALASVIRRRGDRIAAICDASFAHDGESRQDVPEVLDNGPGIPAPILLADDTQALAQAAQHGWSVTIGIGHNPIRRKVARTVLDSNLSQAQLAPLVALSASVDNTAVIGPLVQILEHAHLGPGSSLGEGVIVNTSSIVEHESSVGAFSHVAPGAVLLGNAHLGDAVFFGSGARLLPGLSVAAGSTVGAGAVVTRSIPSTGTYAGVPAQALAGHK